MLSDFGTVKAESTHMDSSVGFSTVGVGDDAALPKPAVHYLFLLSERLWRHSAVLCSRNLPGCQVQSQV